MAILGGRPNNRQVVPYLMVRDGRAALEFYQKAFGAQVLYQAPMPGMPGIGAVQDRRIVSATHRHARIRREGSALAGNAGRHKRGAGDVCRRCR
jgi:uncharacterized glyoxalase superfamily protein PhnB